MRSSIAGKCPDRMGSTGIATLEIEPTRALARSSLSYLGFALLITKFGGTLSSIIETEAAIRKTRRGSLRWLVSPSPYTMRPHAIFLL